MTGKRANRVYIPSKVDHDYESAREFGDLVVLTEGRVDRYKIGELYSQIEKGMRDAQEDDLVLVSGLTVSNAIATAILGRRFGVVNFLLYRHGEYMQRKIILADNVEEKEVEDENDAN